MELKPYRIVAMPFAQSDATAEYTEFGVDEEDALKQFEVRNPLLRVKSVTEK
jgi:hypothetical protein